jgi:DNA replication protein DnaC
MELIEKLKEMQSQSSHLTDGTKMESQTPHSYKCHECNDSGWKWVKDSNGILYCEECPCGIRKKMILENQLKFAELPEMFKDSLFSDLKSNVYLDGKSKLMFSQVAQAVNYWLKNISSMRKSGIGLYLFSSTKGSGKTKTACSIANEIMKRFQIPVKFTTSIRIISEIKDTWSAKNNTENKLIENLSRVEMLVIDDFGTDSGRDWINEKFYEIINGRYVNKKITIFTSNYRISELRYDERITNRILERSLEIPFPEESVREHIAGYNKMKMIEGIGRKQNG